MIALVAAPAFAATLPSADQVAARATACKIDPEQVSWQPGMRDIVAIYVLSVSEDDPDVARARSGGACLEKWAASIGLHPVLTVQIPESH